MAFTETPWTRQPQRFQDGDGSEGFWPQLLSLFRILGIPLTKLPESADAAMQIIETLTSEYLDKVSEGVTRQTVLETLETYDKQLRARLQYASGMNLVSDFFLY